MMNFRVINRKLIELLGGAAAGRFMVTGYRAQADSAAATKNNNRSVQVYYSDGRFTGSTTAPQHKITYAIGLTVSAPTRVDLGIINTPGATPEQIANALSQMSNAAQVADELFDELAELVYQILMDLQNFDLNLPIGTISNRWINSINKDAPVPAGSLVTLTGVVEYTCQTCEIITGEVGVAPVADGYINTVLDQIGDDVEKAGVTAGNAVLSDNMITGGDAFSTAPILSGGNAISSGQIINGGSAQ